jgi:hypothetical protein
MNTNVVFNLSLFTLASKLDNKKKGKYEKYGEQCYTITHIGGKPNADLKRFGSFEFKVCLFSWLEMNVVCELAFKNLV